MIKDADKIDLIYEGAKIYWKKPEVIEEIEGAKLSRKMLEDFYQYRLADIRNKISQLDEVLRFTSYIFDIHFGYSFKILKENNYISKMIDRFDYQIPETKREMMKVKEIANQYIEKKYNEHKS